jgi:ATP/maltotriose-dependent transcriptional regulator MalT/DNA-binding SARP family transcriptional activator
MDDDRRQGRPSGLSAVPRPRLIARLRASPVPPLVVITAGAGFGKSSVVRQWLARSRVIWIGLTVEDRDPSSLLRKIADSVRQAARDPGADHSRRADELLRAAARGGDGTETGTQSRLLADALELATRAERSRAWIVLDDLHEIEGGTSMAMVGGLVRQLPAHVGMVIASRTLLPFPTQRLRSRGLVRELPARELAFDSTELGSVLEDALGPAGAPLAADVMSVTEGWPAAVRLIAEALRALPQERWRSTLASDPSRSVGLFAYLAEEVFAREPAHVTEVIRTIAPFDVVDGELCRDLGVGDGTTVLDDLERRGLFVRRSPDDGGGYVVHGLVRDYVAERLPHSPGELEQARRVGAAWHVRHGRPDAALRLAIASGDAGLIASSVRELGPSLLGRGQADLVVTAIDRLPVEGRSATTLLVQGDAHAFRGRAAAALSAYAGAMGRADASDGRDARHPTPAALAWRIARIHLEFGDPRTAREILETAATSTELLDEALVLAYRALVGYATGDADAVATVRRSVAIADESGDAVARSVAHTVASYLEAGGSRDEARRHRRIALESAEEAGDVVQIVRLRNADDDLPTLDAQFIQATESLAMIEAAGNPVWHVRTLVNRGLVALDLGRLEVAATDFEEARQQASALDPGAEVQPVAFQSELARIRGDLGQAKLGFEQVIERADAVEDRRFSAYARAGLARLLARTEPTRAQELVEQALAETVEHDRPDILVAAAWIAACQDRPADATQLARDAAGRTGSSPGLIATLASALEAEAMADDDAGRRIARLEEASAIWTRIGNRVAAAQTELALAVSRDGMQSEAAAIALDGVRASGVRASAGESAGLLGLLPLIRTPALSVRLFGGFAVLRFGRPVPVSEWKSRKARDILKVLAARRGAPVTRDELIDALWPEDDRQSSSRQTLSVALSLLRRVLDPTRSGPADRYVTTDRQAVALRIDALEIDLKAFVRDARAGLAHLGGGRPAEAIPLLTDAEAAYAGELLPEDLFADWALAPREEARGLYVRVAFALADLALAAGNPALGARYLMRAVAVEPYDESAHIALVRALGVDGRRSDARRAYQAYVTRMAELDIEPAPYPSDDP